LTDFQSDYITVVEDRPIMSVKYCLPVPALPLLAKTIRHPAARSLRDSWSSCYIWCTKTGHKITIQKIILKQ